MKEFPSPPSEAGPAIIGAEEGDDTASGDQAKAGPRHLAKALALAGELSRKLAGERGQAQAVAQLNDLEAELRLAWEEQIALALRVLELGALNLKYRQQVRLGREVVYQDGFYWLGIQGRNKADGPLCPTCWEVEDKLVHLSRASLETGRVADSEDWRQWECPRCNEVFLRKAGLANTPKPLVESKDEPEEG